MKKVLSIALATMMLVSIFAVNASAMIGPTYTEIVGATDEIVMVQQDFSDAEKTDYTSSSGNYSKTTIEDGYATLHTPSASTLHVSSSTPITAETYTVEFDVRRNSDLTNTEYYGVFFGCQKAAYKNDSDKAAKFIDKYGIYFPLMDKEKDTWYTYRITFDETKSADWWTTITSIFTSAQYKKAGDTEWTNININANLTWNVTGNNSRLIAGNNYIGAGETSFMFVSKTGTADAEEIAAASFSLDNIKIYVPANAGEEVVKNYPLYNGTIHLAKEAPSVPSASTGANASTDSTFTTNMTAPVEGTSQYFTVSFDAKNTVQGMPLMFHIGGAKQGVAFAVCSTDTIGNDWYSYRIHCTETASGAYLALNGIYRRPMGSNEPWTKLNPVHKSVYNAETGADILSLSTPSNSINRVRIYYYSDTSVAMYPGSTWTDTVWEMSNLQVTNEAVIAGFANLGDGTIAVDAEIVAATGDAGVALAVYDNENRMTDVAFTRLAGGSGDLDLTADYADGNAANLIVWNYSKDTAKPLVAPIDVAAVAE